MEKVKSMKKVVEFENQISKPETTLMFTIFSSFGVCKKAESYHIHHSRTPSMPVENSVILLPKPHQILVSRENLGFPNGEKNIALRPFNLFTSLFLRTAGWAEELRIWRVNTLSKARTRENILKRKKRKWDDERRL